MTDKCGECLFNSFLPNFGPAIPEDEIEDMINALICKSVRKDSGVIACLTEIKNRHPHTAYHCVKVGVLSGIIGAKIGLRDESLIELIKAGMLHDYGKLFTQLSILNKPARLTPEEFAIIKRHPYIGYMKLKEKNCFSENILMAVLQHHEKLDGTGYPLGLKKSISLYAQIVSVADIFDALTSDRPYRLKNTMMETFKLILFPEGRLDERLVSQLVRYVVTYSNIAKYKKKSLA